MHLRTCTCAVYYFEWTFSRQGPMMRRNAAWEFLYAMEADDIVRPLQLMQGASSCSSQLSQLSFGVFPSLSSSRFRAFGLSCSSCTLLQPPFPLPPPVSTGVSTLNTERPNFSIATAVPNSRKILNERTWEIREEVLFGFSSAHGRHRDSLSVLSPTSASNTPNHARICVRYLAFCTSVRVEPDGPGWVCSVRSRKRRDSAWPSGSVPRR